MRKALILAASLALLAGPARAATAFNGSPNPVSQAAIPYDPAAIYPAITAGVRANQAEAPAGATNRGAVSPETPRANPPMNPNGMNSPRH